MRSERIGKEGMASLVGDVEHIKDRPPSRKVAIKKSATSKLFALGGSRIDRYVPP